jgi:outer membrane immunogenic protein
MKNFLRLTISALLLWAPKAIAADLGDPSYGSAPSLYSPRAAALWTGFYAGAMGGYGAARLNHGQNGLFGQISGGHFGVNGGYNFQFGQSGQFVAGVEADYLWANISNNRSLPGPVLTTAKIDGMMTVRGKFGYAFDRFLPYVTLGYAGGDLRATLFDGSAPVPAGGPFYAHHRWRNGFAAGLGLEYAIADHVSVKAEYLYASLRSRSIFVGAYAGAAGADVSMLRMGLNYRF